MNMGLEETDLWKSLYVELMHRKYANGPARNPEPRRGYPGITTDRWGVINLTIRTTYFTTNGKISEQIFGPPMGSPLSPVLANVYMNKIEENFKMASLQPTVLMWYVDDYFALWSRGREKLEKFLKFVSQIDEKIQFTLEVEDGERLPFLDVEVIRPNGTLKEKLFRKKSYAGIILNFRCINEEHDHPKTTPNGCRILGRGAGKTD
ncbi:unnamed protein product [Protopolystoma xenopodis]|uniref:Reverse transcriptase domain-containing protein n=1 Tax=Protopolystoma xenopodis TaxID=117903 RepID=A0A3S5BR28_9PLAT|nr:unnamed protein product [Protopolystoma xenopodis]